MSVEVVCAGVLVADTFVPPLPRLPAAGELMATGDFWHDSGGCAANTATCLGKLGVRAGVVGKVGRDASGNFVEQDLKVKGVDTSGLRRSERLGTSETVILPVSGDDRRYIHTFGANADFRVEDISREQVAGAEVFYVGGYLILPSFDPGAFRELLAFTRGRGVRTVLDVVVTQGGGAWEALAAVLPEVDFITPNDYEAQLLTGEREPRAQAEYLLRAGCGTAIITQGEKGALLARPGQVLELPAFPLPVVDGSGAGDAFAAGLIAGLLRGWELGECLRLASAVGASACTKLGCTTGVFTRSQAEDFLRAHPPAK
ncbi:MAG: carbohydrate kinase family protein [Candidatus Latescibacteria bacterium]|nr:carbohydrate kinase family protein [Candidatus Latescibacterota bacterium]